MLICSKCGKRFKEWRSNEEKLLQAIFGDSLCKECRMGYGICAKCGKPAEKPIYFNEEPYHPKCLPYGEGDV